MSTDSFIIAVTFPPMEVGKTESRIEYLKGPRPPAEVKRHGYAFTSDTAEAWTFPTVPKAQVKARIIERHMSRQVTAEVIPLPGQEK